MLLGVPYAAMPGVRPLELDLYLPPDGDGPLPVVVFLHGGGWRLGSRHTAGPAYRGADPTPFEQVAQAGDRRRQRRLPALRRGDLAGPAARREGRRPLAARPRRRARHRPRPDRRLGRVGRRPPRRAARPDRGRRRRSRATSGSPARRARSSAVVAWYAPSDVAAVATDTRRRPGRPDHPRGAAARRPGAERARARRAGQPGQPRLRRRPAVPAAARRGPTG